MNFGRLLSILALALFSVEYCFGTAPLQETPDRIIHIDSGLSIRNHEKGHYYPTMEWDETPYKEFAYWEETEKGSIIDFMNFRVAFPPNYSRHSGNAYPAIVSLHGGNGSGRKWDEQFLYSPSDPLYDNNSGQLDEGNGKGHYEALHRIPSDPRYFPGIIIVPQSSYNGSWGTKDRVAVARFLEWMIENYHVNPDRIAIHGLSNGAKGVWTIASGRPDLFAATMPMSGVGTDIDSMTDIHNTTPMWIFQGELDSNPSKEYSKSWYDELVSKGGTPMYTLYENAGHGTWWLAYKEPELHSWIRAQHKKKVHVMYGDTHGYPPANPCTEPFSDIVGLGFSHGFLAYQWYRNGEAISGESSRFITAAEEGIYHVEFQRRTDSTWDESYSIDIFYTEPNLPELVPELEASGVTVLPVLSSVGDRSLKLIAQRGFAAYEWYKDGQLLNDSTSEELVLNNASGTSFNPEDTGAYTVKVFTQHGCASRMSGPIEVEYILARELDTTNLTTYFAEGVSIQNFQKDVYQSMVDWEDSAYHEFAYWKQNDWGFIKDFMNWRGALPADSASGNDTTRYSAIIVLHGADGSGREAQGLFDYQVGDPEYDNNGAQLRYGGQEHLQAIGSRSFDGFVISPQVNINASWTDDELLKVADILEWMLREYPINPSQVVLVGVSEGAEEAWTLASKRPDLFAGALFIGGLGDHMEEAISAMAPTPIWLAQGADDIDPTVAESKAWYNLLAEQGVNAKYTLYEGGADIWDKVFAEGDYFTWVSGRDQRNIQVLDSTEGFWEEIKIGISPGFLDYQWLLNEEEIAGANDRYLTATDPGIYSVKFKRRTDSTWSQSYPLNLDYPILEPKIYPNPSADILNIQFPDNSYLNGQLIIYDTSSRKFLDHQVSNRNTRLDLRTLEPGVYILRVRGQSFRFIKIN